MLGRTLRLAASGLLVAALAIGPSSSLSAQEGTNIYTTARDPSTMARVQAVYEYLCTDGDVLAKALKKRIQHFKKRIAAARLPFEHLPSDSPIQCLIVPGNAAVVACSQHLEALGLDVRPIRKPTVPGGKERLRICLHVHNSLAEIDQLVDGLLAFSRLEAGSFDPQFGA